MRYRFESGLHGRGVSGASGQDYERILDWPDAGNQEAFQFVTGSNQSQFAGYRLPVESVSWEAASSYCHAAGMRLPTEAEWEYAARAGSTASRYGPIGQIAWYLGNSGNGPHEVMQKVPNGWGLYDMLGNVWEWTADWSFGRHSGASETDPQGAADGNTKILRGGSWKNNTRASRVSIRLRGSLEIGTPPFGFRCVGELPEEGAEGDVQQAPPAIPEIVPKPCQRSTGCFPD